jgi:hypothetical protein
LKVLQKGKRKKPTNNVKRKEIISVSVRECIKPRRHGAPKHLARML